MKVVDLRKSKLWIHCEQFLNVLNEMDVLINKLVKDTLGNCKCFSMHNNFNASMKSDVDFSSPIAFAWGANWWREKRMQTMKE